MLTIEQVTAINKAFKICESLGYNLYEWLTRETMYHNANVFTLAKKHIRKYGEFPTMWNEELYVIEYPKTIPWFRGADGETSDLYHATFAAFVIWYQQKIMYPELDPGKEEVKPKHLYSILKRYDQREVAHNVNK